MVATVTRICGVVVLYIGWHAIATQLLPAHTRTSNGYGWALVGVGYLGLFAVKTCLQLYPNGRFARACHSWLFSGFYLDERFTRLTFRIWPPRLRQPVNSSAAIPLSETLEAQV